MENKRINVGLFVGKLDNPFDNAVCEGAMRGAKEADVNLMIFPGRYLKGQYYERERTRAEYQNNALFSYVDKKNIDVFVMTEKVLHILARAFFKPKGAGKWIAEK